MTTVEHALPVPTLFEDVLTLYALSGTGATPTHIVNYGGAWGEQIVWATENVPNDPKYEPTSFPANLSYCYFPPGCVVSQDTISWSRCPNRLRGH
jgi:hypothetical protein